jgi:hypothetical protein
MRPVVELVTGKRHLLAILQGSIADDCHTIQPSLPPDPITTHFNLLVVGASRSGKGEHDQGPVKERESMGCL